MTRPSRRPSASYSAVDSTVPLDARPLLISVTAPGLEQPGGSSVPDLAVEPELRGIDSLLTLARFPPPAPRDGRLSKEFTCIAINLVSAPCRAAGDERVAGEFTCIAAGSVSVVVVVTILVVVGCVAVVEEVVRGLF